MKFIAKLSLTTAAILALYILIVGLGWADVFFWKTGGIARVCTYIMRIIVPIDLLPITPGSRLDTPWFFIPAIISALLLWAIIILVTVEIVRTKK